MMASFHYCCSISLPIQIQTYTIAVSFFVWIIRYTDTFSFRVMFSYLIYNHGLDFDISLLHDNSINQ